MKSEESNAVSKTHTSLDPFLTVNDQPIYFQEDWDTGIGGGLWSTGLAIARYLQTQHGVDNLASKRSILELGSGNGLLAACLVAASSPGTHVTVTDVDEEHLSMIRKTMGANQHLLNNKETTICLHKWGDFSNLQHLQSDCSFDLIVGSDVAYREDLYDPLICTLNKICRIDTVVLLGVTMADTRPIFFDMLQRHGFMYLKLSERLVDAEFRGNTFGIFIMKERPKRV